MGAETDEVRFDGRVTAGEELLLVLAGLVRAGALKEDCSVSRWAGRGAPAGA